MTDLPVTNTAQAHMACANCEKAITVLRHCAKCKTVAYCNRDCQKNHWKTHKKECYSFANKANSNVQTSTTPDEAQANPDLKPFTAISNNTFLHNRSEEETFKILIDVIRMRQEDTYVFEGDTMTGTIYNEESSSASALRTFLSKARKIPGFLPSWWTGEKVAECVQFGLRNPDRLLKYAQEKSDIQERWNDDKMPMKLRMLGERVYGSTPGSTPGQSSDAMLGMMKMMEDSSNSLYSSTLDVAKLFSSR